MLTKKRFLILCTVIAVLFSACKSTGKPGEGKESSTQEQTKNTLTKYPGTMLWRIDGVSQTGDPSTVYLLGTYHAGDQRAVEFPECVKTAIDSADRFCCELSKSDWNNMQSMMTELTMQSVLTDLSHTFIDDLTQEEIILVSTFIDQQSLAQLVCFEPWVLNNYLQQILILASGLDVSKAYDVMIMQEIEKRQMDFDGLDPAQTQLDLIAYGDWDTQLVMLRDTLSDLENLNASAKDMTDLYEVYLAGDEEAFEQAYYKDFDKDLQDETKRQIYQAYIKALLADRNESWVPKIDEYIKKGGTTFIFAGCAHLVGPDSVFVYLKQNGVL